MYDKQKPTCQQMAGAELYLLQQTGTTAQWYLFLISKIYHTEDSEKIKKKSFFLSLYKADINKFIINNQPHQSSWREKI